VKSRVRTVPLRSFDAIDEAIATVLHIHNKQQSESSLSNFTKDEVLTLMTYLRRLYKRS
jgi:hypothetical protein